MSVAAKICGLSSEDAVAAAVEGGAAYLGFVFYPPSPRSVSPARAGALCAEVPASVRRVGLFVDADDAAIGRVLDAAPLDLLQFHGRESPERVAALHQEDGLTILLVEQRVAEALESCDYGYVLETGRVALEGTHRTLMADDRVRRAYLGM